eukprot:jgi/Botrbrau1/9988/Bobra.0012s0077.1
MSKQAIYIVFLAGLLSLVSGDAVAQLRTETDNRVETVTFGFNWGWGGGRYWNGGSWWGGNGGWWSGPWGRFYQGWNPGFHPGWNGGGVSTGWSQIGWGDQGRFFWRCPWNTIGYWGGGCWGCGTWFCQGCNYPSCPPCQFWDPSRGSCIPAFQGCGNIPDCGVCSFFDPSYNNGQGACIQAQGCGQSYGCANCYNVRLFLSAPPNML